MSNEELETLREFLTNGADIRSFCCEVNKTIDELKDSLNGITLEKQINLNSYRQENIAFSNKVEELSKKIEDVGKENADLIKELNNCCEEITDLSKSLKECIATSNVLKWIVQLHKKLQSACQKIKQEKLFAAAHLVHDTHVALNDSAEFEDLEMKKSVFQEAILMREQVLFVIAEFWASCVEFTIDKTNEFTIISVGIKHRTSFLDAVKASFFLSDNLIHTKFFSKLKEHILLPLIIFDGEVSASSDSENSVLNVRINSAKTKPNYLDVFQRIICVMEFVKTSLNVNLDDGTDVMVKMGESVAHDLTATLMKDCLTLAIPSEPSKMKIYTEIVSNAEKFQSTLQSFKFLPCGLSTFMDHSQDVNLLFANKIYLSYLESAKDIMKKDLHTVKSCEDIVLAEAFPPKALEFIIENLNLKDRKQIFLQKCQISKSAQDLIDLVTAIEKEMEASDDNRCIRLLYTIRNIFEMYTAVVPLHHKKMLETLPQQVGLFHNNCLHFAFYLLTFASRCVQNNSLRDHCPMLFDQAVSLRQLGVRSLENTVSNQRSQLVYILRDSGLDSLCAATKLDLGAEKAIRQCIRQLQLLRNIWAEILPENVFNNAMGFLIDAFVGEIVTLVLAAEDISSQAASGLVNIFKIVQERIPSVLKDSREVHRLCRKWGRFSELVFVLDGNLSSINSRWAEGAGPLACEFTADQVKHLVRALFQNTDQRAALLGRIK